ERVRGFFRPQPYETLEDFDATSGREPRFKAWYRYNTRAHRVPGYRAVFVALKAHGHNPGDMSSDQMDAVASLAERVSFGLIRTTHNQNLLLADVRQKDLYEAWLELERLGVAKRGEEWYQISLGGSANGFTALGEVIGPSVPKSEVASTIERIVEAYRALRADGERFIDTLRRVGLEPFREGAYATHPAAA